MLDPGEVNKIDTILILTGLTVCGGIRTVIQWVGLGQDA